MLTRIMSKDLNTTCDQAFSDSSGIQTPSTDSISAQSSVESFENESFTSMYSLYKTPWVMEQIASRTGNVFIDVTKLDKMADHVMYYMVLAHEAKCFHTVTRRYLRLSSRLPNEDKTIDLLFVMNALNFSLWIPNSTKQWTVHKYQGYKALKAAITRAIFDGYALWDPEYYTDVSKGTLKHILRGDDNVPIPLLDERIKVLRDIGQVLIDDYKGSFVNCVNLCQGNPDKLLYVLFNEFECFRDKARYDDLEVCLGSKAVTLIGDLSIFQKINLDTRTMQSTMFTDYRSAEIFLHFKVLYYGKRLADKLKEKELLEYGSKEELELRCCSLVAYKMLYKKVLLRCEHYIKEVPVLKDPTYNISMLIDNFLWQYRHVKEEHLNENILRYNIVSQYYY